MKWVIIRSVIPIERVIIWVILMTWLRSLLFFRAVVTLCEPFILYKSNSTIYSISRHERVKRKTTWPAGAEKETQDMKLNIKNAREQERGRQKGKFEHFNLQNDEFDPYAIVVLNQL